MSQNPEIKFSMNEYQNKYYHEKMTNEEWRKHRAEIVLNNMRKMRAKKRAELIASGIEIKMGRKKGGKNKPKVRDENSPSEPPELFNITL
jgi:hypothetical protein